MRFSSTSTTWSTSAECAAFTEEKSASPSGVKKQSTTSLPPWDGRLIGRHSLPNTSWMRASSPGRSTLSASILFTRIIRHRPRRPAARIMRVVLSSMPVCALITITAVSTAASAAMDCPAKSGMPGVSIRWTWMPL